MKQKKLYLCILLLFFLVGCSQRTTEEIKKVPEIKIGLTAYRRDDTFINMIISNIQEEGKEAEQQKNMKVTMNIMDAKGSQTMQNEHNLSNRIIRVRSASTCRHSILNDSNSDY